MTQELKLMVGIPGSGKSTWIQQEVEYIESEHRTTCVISRDCVRQSLLRSGEDYFARETEVFNEFVRQINEAMETGFDVIFVDATHISLPSRRKVLSRLMPDPATNLTFEVIGCTLETAIERNSKREGFSKVPKSAIRRMATQFQCPNYDEIPADNYGFNSVSINYHNIMV